MILLNNYSRLYLCSQETEQSIELTLSIGSIGSVIYAS